MRSGIWEHISGLKHNISDTDTQPDAGVSHIVEVDIGGMKQNEMKFYKSF